MRGKHFNFLHVWVLLLTWLQFRPTRKRILATNCVSKQFQTLFRVHIYLTRHHCDSPSNFPFACFILLFERILSAHGMTHGNRATTWTATTDHPLMWCGEWSACMIIEHEFNFTNLVSSLLPPSPSPFLGVSSPLLEMLQRSWVQYWTWIKYLSNDTLEICSKSCKGLIHLKFLRQITAHLIDPIDWYCPLEFKRPTHRYATKCSYRVNWQYIV